MILDTEKIDNEEYHHCLKNTVLKVRVMSKSPSSRLSVLPFLLFLIACLNSPAHGQMENGTIYGSVTDPTGAVVPDATIRLTDVDRGLEIEVSTGSTGFYTFATVSPGHYQIRVEKSGFKTVLLTGITVNVQDNLEDNFKLDVGSASDAITVTANAANVNTTDGAVSSVVDHTFADNIPLNGRSFQTLIMLTPGVVVTQTAFDDQGQFSVNGQRADANYFSVDGVSADFGVTGYLPLMQSGTGALPALTVQGGTNSLVSVDAMQEFRVQTSSFAPEFGRMPGGQISILTRSGTNRFHGTVFEYFRNDVLDANNWFNGYTNHPPLPKAEERQNDFGGNLGGPILKDKAFFFFSYEGLRLRQPSTQETAVPDTASRQQAPATMQPFLNAYPVPNGPELGSGLAQFNGSYSDPSSLNAYSIRLDHAISSKLRLFGRYNHSPSQTIVRNPFGVLSTTQPLSASVHTLTVGVTHLITPHVINEVRANYSNDRVRTRYAVDTFGGAMPPPDSQLFPAGFSSSNGLFQFLIVGAGEFAKGKYGTDEQRQLDFVDNVSVGKGRHQFKFGVDYRWLSPFSSPASYGQFAEFTGITSNPGGALSGVAAFADTQALQSDALLIHNLSLYGQDTWRITPRLTATYGLRWDRNPPLKGKNLANQPFTVANLNDPANLVLAPRGTALYQTRNGNVAPRIGVAYQFRGTTDWLSVLRGGFGIFNDLGSGSLGGASSYFPFFAINVVSPAPFPLSPQNAARPVLTTSPPVFLIFVAERDMKLPRVYEWNAALEQSLGSSQTLSLTYVGAVGSDLLRVTNLYAPNSDFGLVGVTDNSATSDYHALQLKFQRRFSRGLQALSSYTWSHSIDIASTDAAFNYLSTPTSVAKANIDRGNSDFDVRHAFTAGVTYNLPSPAKNNIAHAALGGWSVDAFIFARSAPPVDVVAGQVFVDGISMYPRPNVNPGVPLVLYGSHYPGGKILNGAAFSSPPDGQQGGLGRNVLRAFGASQGDIAFERQFNLREGLQLRFRGEFFNIFNHPNFGPPDSNTTDALFGYSTQMLASSLGSGGANGGLNPLYQIGGPRSVQLALKLQF